MIQRYSRLTLLLPVILLAPLVLWAQESGAAEERLAPYYPTPSFVVRKMLKLGGLQPGETMYDLGSGDGRIVIMAARDFKARAVGVEIDRDLVERSRSRIERAKLGDRARIIQGDIMTQDYSSADLLTIYLLPTSNDKVRPLLEKQLKKGARVVSHDFDINGWTPDQVEHVEDDGEGRSHTLYLYFR